MNSHHVPVSVCPICQYEMDCATNVQGKEPPNQNSFSLCLRCGEILRFTPELKLREVTLSDLLELPRDVDRLLTKAQQLIRQQRPKV